MFSRNFFRVSRSLRVALVVAVMLLVPSPARAATVGQWRLVGSMTSFHGISAVATLHDGRVLAMSGADGLGGLTASAELFDPATEAWTPTGSVNDPRMAFHNPVVLADGRVLIAGGHDAQVNDYASAELYDPATGQWTRTGSLNTSRRYAVTVGLQDGRVLVATGAHGAPDGSRFLSTAELYDPATGQWTFTGSAATRRESATGIRLLDGRVVVVGGYTCCDFFTPATDVYNPATGTWSAATNRPHGGVGMALVALRDGRLLMVGGNDPGAGVGATTDALMFDPATGQWSATAPLHYARSGAAAVQLPSGKVLVAGGGPQPSEVYDPTTGTWSDDAPLSVGRVGASIAPLPTGNVLIAGGSAENGITTTSEVYSPPPVSTTRAAFTTTPQAIGRGITFDASGSTITPGTTATYRWDFDNDSTVDQVTSTPTTVHEYPDTQPRRVTLTVVDSGGGSDSITENVIVPLDTVLVLLPGLQALAQQPPGGAYEQVKASNAFHDLLAGLGCVDPPASAGITTQCNTTSKARLFWSPYSYRGPNGQAAPNNYGGADTHQPLAASAAQLDSQIQQIGSKHPGARLVLVGHSTGGTIATRWASDHGRVDTPVVTLDAPAFGFWPEDPATSANEDQDHYCGLSLPGNRIATPAQQTAPFLVTCSLWTVGGFRSQVSYDWRGDRSFGVSPSRPAINALQLFSAGNRSDVVVPPWWSVSPQADGNKIVQCTDPLGSHACILHDSSVLTGTKLVVQSTVDAALERRAPTAEATRAGWGSTVGSGTFDGYTTTISVPSLARIVAVGEWGPVAPAADGLRHGDGPEAHTLTCAFRPSTPARTVNVSSADWRSRSYVVFWRFDALPGLIARSQVRVLPYADTKHFDATVQVPDIGLNSLANPCSSGGS